VPFVWTSARTSRGCLSDATPLTASRTHSGLTIGGILSTNAHGSAFKEFSSLVSSWLIRQDSVRASGMQAAPLTLWLIDVQVAAAKTVPSSLPFSCLFTGPHHQTNHVGGCERHYSHEQTLQPGGPCPDRRAGPDRHNHRCVQTAALPLIIVPCTPLECLRIAGRAHRSYKCAGTMPTGALHAH